MSRPQHGRDYTADYGGQLVRWPKDADETVDWAQAFPIPDRKKVPRDAHQLADSDDEGYYDDDFWFSPRMAALLHHCGCTYADQVLEDDMETSGMDEWTIEDLPSVAQPYARNASWALAFREASRRLVARLAKGQRPHPNCTGEEMALHKIIELAQALYSDGDEGIMDTLEGLPKSTADEDFDMVSELAFEDQDVLMLYDMADAVLGNGPMQHMMDFANLHPDEWFKPFKQERVNDHVRQ